MAQSLYQQHFARILAKPMVLAVYTSAMDTKKPKIILACIGIALVFFVANIHSLNINLLPTDDHEIVMISKEPLGSWLDSEAFRPWSRWRPSYYTIRSLEALLWGNSSLAWHLARLIGISSSICLLTLSATQLLGPATGLLFGITLVFSPLLNSLTQILGPAETYCFLGISLWAYGYIGLLDNLALINDSHIDTKTPATIAGVRILSILVCIGSVIAAGSKENLVILIFPNAWLLRQSIYSERHNIKDRVSRVVLGIACASMLPMALFLINLYAVSGRDIYSKSLKPSALEMLIYIAKSFHWGGIAITGASLLTLSRVLIVSHKFQARSLILAFLVFLSMWSVYVNREVIPFWGSHRYALLHQLGLLGMLWIIISYWTDDLRKLGTKVRKYFFASTSLIIVITGSLFTMRHSYAASSSLSKYSQRWQLFTSSVSKAHQQTNLPITIVSSHWFKSYEPSYSAARFLRFLRNIEPRSISISYIPDQETRSREKDDFQKNLESSIILSRDLDKSLRSPSGGVVKIEATPYSSENLASMKKNDRICAIPIESEETSFFLSDKCSKVISF